MGETINGDLRIGMTFTGKVSKLGLKGDGIVFIGKCVCFLPGGEVGGVYRFEIVSITDRFCNGRIIKKKGGAL